MIDDLLWTKPRTVDGMEILRPPTVRAFFRALAAYGREIGSLRKASRHLAATGGLDPEIAVSAFLYLPDDERFAYVLEDVVPDRGFPYTAEERRRYLLAIVGVLGPNVARLDALFGDPEAERPLRESVGDDSLLVFGCAERFHVDPRSVMDWPLGTFLDVVEAFSKPESVREPKVNVAEYVGDFVGAPVVGTGVVGGPVRAGEN